MAAQVSYVAVDVWVSRYEAPRRAEADERTMQAEVAVEFLLATVAKRRSPRPQEPEMRARNTAIVNAVAQGGTHNSVAQEFGVTASRVSQIVRDERNRLYSSTTNSARLDIGTKGVVERADLPA